MEYCLQMQLGKIMSGLRVNLDRELCRFFLLFSFIENTVLEWSAERAVRRGNIQYLDGSEQAS